MPTIFFEANLFGSDVRVEAAGGEALVDICDNAMAPVPFSCRSATCGTCRIEVVEGGDLLAPREEAEAELLAILGDPPTIRLACQAKVKPGDGTIHLRIAGDAI
jgi:ferredoxin